MRIINLFFVLIITFSFAHWEEKAPVPEPVGPGDGITYGRGYVFAIVGNESDGFYAYDITQDRWINDLEMLPEPINNAGAITYGKSEFGLENIFIAAQIEDEDQLFVYSFEDTLGPYGDWEELEELPEEVGPGVSLTFRPLNQIFYVIPCPIIIYHGELYLTIGNDNSDFYSLRFVELRPYPIPPSYIFPPDDTTLEAMKIFFSWNKNQGASNFSYQIQVDNDINFSSPIIDAVVNKNFYIPKKIFSPGVYFWRTKTLDSPLWSETRKFTIDYNWIRRADVPQGVGRGGSIAYHRYNNAESIYCLIGGGRINFYCYSVNRNSWFEVANSPLLQREGSSITSCYQTPSAGVARYLLAIFGESEQIERHWRYGIHDNDWERRERLPAILRAGASITYDPRDEKEDAYLVIGGNRNNFYVNNYPVFEENGTNGGQSQINNKKEKDTKVCYSSDNIVINYSLSNYTQVTIQVYDIAGRLVKNLFSGRKEKGRYQISWNKKNERGNKISKGIYFITIRRGDLKENIKIINTE